MKKKGRKNGSENIRAKKQHRKARQGKKDHKGVALAKKVSGTRHARGAAGVRPESLREEIIDKRQAELSKLARRRTRKIRDEDYENYPDELGEEELY